MRSSPVGGYDRTGGRALKIVLALVLAAIPARCTWKAIERRTSQEAYWAAVNEPGPIRVIDGDTVERNGFKHRLKGFDAPETGRAKCSAERLRGAKANARLHDLITSSRSVALTATKHIDRYDRHLSTLTIDGVDVADIAFKEGWGMPYDGRGVRTDWCAPQPLNIPNP